jgi:hypothetical protein
MIIAYVEYLQIEYFQTYTFFLPFEQLLIYVKYDSFLFEHWCCNCLNAYYFKEYVYGLETRYTTLSAYCTYVILFVVTLSLFGGFDGALLTKTAAVGALQFLKNKEQWRRSLNIFFSYTCFSVAPVRHKFV